MKYVHNILQGGAIFTLLVMKKCHWKLTHSEKAELHICT